MFRTNIIAALAVGLFAASTVDLASAASGKCNSISARCAVEIGGVCDLKTGRWEYGRHRYTGSGGTNRGGAFDGCVSRELKKRKG
jgi:hypothetical protein